MVTSFGCFEVSQKIERFPIAVNYKCSNYNSIITQTREKLVDFDETIRLQVQKDVKVEYL